MAVLLRAIVGQGFLVGALAATRDLQGRIAAGECAAPASSIVGASFFPTGAQVGRLPSLAAAAAEGGVQAANLISVKYGNSFKVLTAQVAKEQYVLTQCGIPAPSDTEVDSIQALDAGFQRKYFTIPLQQVVAESTVQLGFLQALGVEDRVVRLTRWASGGCWQKALGCGAALEDAWSGNATVLQAQRSSAEVVFMDCSLGDGCKSVRSRANAVHFAAAQEPQPLYSAEHIKFMAAFFNKEREASASFDGTVAAYTAAKVAASPRPVVAWIQYTEWPEPQLELSQASYKLRMAADAGGANVDFGAVRTRAGAAMDANMAVKLSAFNGSIATASAAFFAALGQVDAVVDETYAMDPANYSMHSFLSKFNLAAGSSLRFIQQRAVLRQDGTLSAASGLDWFESRLAHPDWAVEGLARVLFVDNSKRKKYFRNIASGETADFILPGMCAQVLPVCTLDALPQPIAMPAKDASLVQTTSTLPPASSNTTVRMTSGGARLAPWSGVAALVLVFKVAGSLA